MFIEVAREQAEETKARIEKAKSESPSLSKPGNDQSTTPNGVVDLRNKPGSEITSELRTRFPGLFRSR